MGGNRGGEGTGGRFFGSYLSPLPLLLWLAKIQVGDLPQKVRITFWNSDVICDATLGQALLSNSREQSLSNPSLLPGDRGHKTPPRRRPLH